MDIKDILSQSKTWMIVCSIITLFMLGIGPMTVSSEGIANMAEDAFGDMYTNATVEDKGTIEESVKEDAYFFGAANVSLAVFILGFAFLTEGKHARRVQYSLAGRSSYGQSTRKGTWTWRHLHSILSFPFL